MDPASPSPDLPERAVSPEHSSTRPNPFADADDSSRKRQRTSLSDSPMATHDNVNPVNPVTANPGPTTADAPDQASDAAMDLGQDPLAPRTPEQQLNSNQGEPADPPSSRVTINLRHRQRSDSPSSSPVRRPSPTDPGLSMPEADQLKRSVEGLETNMVPAPEKMLVTPLSSSSVSTSPPIEVISIGDDEDGDDDMVDEVSNAGVSIIGEDQALIDPTYQFPYRDSEETLCETVHRLSQYISGPSSIDPNVLFQVKEWLDLYLQFAKQVDRWSVLESCREQRSFWVDLPDVIQALATRKPSLLKSSAIHHILKELYFGFARLTARFVALDFHSIRNFRADPRPHDHRGPGLLSIGYLQHLHYVTLRDDFPVEGDFVELTESAVAQSSFAPSLINKLLMSPGGSVECLAQFAVALTKLIVDCPKYADVLAPVSQILADCMSESFRMLFVVPEGLPLAKQRLEVGHASWTAISESLNTTIEKNIVCLSSESARSQMEALTDMLKLCLQGDHEKAVDTLALHRQRYPNLPAKYTCEAVALEWRFGMLATLIRSSQMQLRVTAVTMLCTDLVSAWKRLSDSEEDYSMRLLDHIGHCLLETQIIDYVLGPNCHPEIITESANVIGFLVVTKLYRKEHTEKLWQGVIASKDPRVADALSRVITIIANLFDSGGLLGLCEKFQSLPIEAFSHGIRTMWDNILRELITKCKKEGIMLGFLPYDLCLRLLRESSICASGSQVAYPDIQQAALQMFKELLNFGPDPDGRHQLYMSCIQDVSAKSPTTLGSLWCLSMAIRPTMAREMQVLIDRHDLARLIVGELDHAIQSGQEVGVPAVLSGATNQPRRDFITNLMFLQPGAIDNDLGTKLWSLLVGPQSSCQEDRQAGWQIILAVGRRASFQNPFLKACCSRHLPALAPAYFCDGTLQFIKEEILSVVNHEDNAFVLDDETMVQNSGIEQLWRMILATDDTNIVDLAIATLAAGVYLESRTIAAYPFHRTQRVHLSLVNRCLHQLQDAARKMKASSDGTTSGDDEPMVIVATDEEIQEQERIFVRSLHVLRYFLEAHQSRPHFAAPDLRSLMSKAPFVVEGDPAHLKYQSFDGAKETEVKPLNIGKLNTASALLASLSQETGFENYHAYYRGRPFLPTEHEICKSLQDLDIRDGLMLVRRAENGPSKSYRIKPGSSPLEIEILAHFQEMWEYLSLEDKIAKEIYTFLVKLPADAHIMDLFENDATSYKDLFLSGQPFKSLYAIHALVEYTATARSAVAGNDAATSSGSVSSDLYGDCLRRSLRLLVQAISDEKVLEKMSATMQMQLMSSLMRTYEKLLKEAYSTNVSIPMEDIGTPSPDRLVTVLASAIDTVGETAISLISSTLATILRLGLGDSKFWEDVTAHPRFVTLMQYLVLFDIRKAARKTIADLVENTIEAEDRIASAQPTSPFVAPAVASHVVTRYFWSVFAALLPAAVTLPDRCNAFFGILQFILTRMSARVPLMVDLPQLAGQASELLLNHSATENIDQIEPHDPVAKGLTYILHSCLHNDESSVTSSIPEDVAEDLFWGHLFPKQRTDSQQPVSQVVLNTDTRAKLYEIVFRLVRHDRRKFKSILQALTHLVPFYHSDNDDHYLYELPGQFERLKAIRSPSGYVGLKNLSNTCYLNSLFTQLFMNIEFRRFIMQSTAQDPEGSQQLLHYTQRMFGCMQESYRRFVDPVDVVSSIKTYDDTAVDIHSQMDVDEFYNLLFDRWEGQFLGGDEKKKLRSFYGGQLVQQVKSKECEHISERLEPFSAIQCDIKGKTTLKDSLQAYVDGEVLEGDNKYKCSTCDRHVDAVKRACLKDIPDNLIFHLKRFDFNLRTLQRSKINDYFSFPPSIDLRPFTIEHLSDPDEDDVEDIFELVGVLVHSGTAESGHYYSYIRERPSSPGRQGWAEFNDEAVTPFDPDLLGTSTFGGPDPRAQYETNGNANDKTYSAYMLFYQRATSIKSEQQVMSHQGIPAPLHVEVDQQLKEHIVNENTVLLRRHCLYDPNHTAFVESCFSQAGTLDESRTAGSDSSRGFEETFEGYLNAHDLKSLAMEMAIGHLDQVVTRSKDLIYFHAFAEMIRTAVAECHHCAFDFYNYFNERHPTFRALIQRHQDPRVRTFAGQVFMTAVEKISTHFPHRYDPKGTNAMSTDSDSDGDDRSRRLSTPGTDKPVIEGVVLILNNLWRFFHVHIRSWDDYFGLVLDFAQLGDREVAHLLSQDYLAKLLRIVSADPMMEMTAPYARMLHNVLRRINSRPPSYTSIISATEHLLTQLMPVLGPEVMVEAPEDRLNMDRPFPWTADEVQLVHSHPKRQFVSLFVEKLLGIDQAHELANDIVGFLVSTGSQVDHRVVNTLRKNTQADISTQIMDPFFKAAGRYLDYTQSEEHAHSLISHISGQVKNLQSTEGAAFLDFFRSALDSRRPSTKVVDTRDYSIDLVLEWAPYMLSGTDGRIRHDAEQLICDEIFAYCSPSSEPIQYGSPEEQKKAVKSDTVRNLGLKCVVYLRDVHVSRRAQIGRDAAATMLRVLGRCRTYHGADADSDPNEDADDGFVAIYSEIMEPLVRLMVDEVEDDVSGTLDGLSDSETAERELL